MLRILLIDDNPQDRLLAIRALEREFPTVKVEEVIKPEDFALALEEIERFDLVITDYQLRWSDGLAVLRTIKSQCPDCPTIMFTNSGSQEVAVEAMKAGLDDYVIKSPTHYVRLAVAVRSVWEKSQTKRKVRGLENRLQSLLNQLNVGVFRCTEQGHLLEGNPAFFRLLGLKETPPVRDIGSLKSYFLPEDYAQLFNGLKENGQSQDREVQLRQVDGTTLWVRLSKTIDKSEGQIIIDGLMEDISDRKRVEAERYRREQEFKALVENAPDIIARLDRELHYVYVNPAVKLVTGVTPERLIGKTRAEFGIPEDLYALWQEKTRQVFVTRKECLYEFKFPAPGGTLYFQTRMVPELALDGTVESVLCIGRDVTEYKLTEQALKASESRFRRLVESNMIGCIFWETNGKITDANDAFLRMVGYTREDLLAGKLNWKELTPAEQLALSEQALAQMEEFGGASPLEKEYICADGHRVPVVLGGVLLEGSQDKGVSFVLDLSDRKQLENQLRQQAEQLEQTNRIKDEFLAILSHELRSPLNSILGWAKLLRSRTFDEATISKALETIERNATMQTRLIEDLLDISRIIRGKTSLNICAVDLALTVEAAIDTVRLAAQAKSIQIEFASDPNVGFVSGDPNRLQQVIWNLLSNAIKFTPSGGRVAIHLQRQGTQAQLQVTDTGKGINANFLAHVFEYFRQADGSTTRTEGGLGLGLAIVRHLVELHGGNVSASSPGVGQGATFTVQLPLLKESQESAIEKAGRSTSPSPSPAPTPHSPLTGLRVLVVDDETDARDFYTAVLEAYGAQVTTVASVKEALEALERQCPDVLISDIGMPGEDGYMLLRQVRAREARRGGHLPALALTAYARGEDCKKALDAGFQKHMSKPVNPDDLVMVVGNLVMRRL